MIGDVSPLALVTLALYALSGELLWRLLAVTSTEAEAGDLLRDLHRGSAAALIVKGIFVLTWPILFAVAWVSHHRPRIK